MKCAVMEKLHDGFITSIFKKGLYSDVFLITFGASVVFVTVAIKIVRRKIPLVPSGNIYFIFILLICWCNCVLIVSIYILAGKY